MNATGKIWIALDCDKTKALEIAKILAPSSAVYGFKINRLADEEMYRKDGEPGLFSELGQYMKELWVDLKFMDIPETVKGRTTVHASSGVVNFLTVMARGGIPMMMAAIEAGRPDTGIIAVTELTSLSEEEVHLYSGHPVKASVTFLAQQAVLAGIVHIVCSGQEIAVIRKQPELAELELFVPAVRPDWYQQQITKDKKDQKRTITPVEVLKFNRSKIVIGRPIVDAEDPLEALNKTTEEIEAAA